jgi:hypothetical protein
VKHPMPERSSSRCSDRLPVPRGQGSGKGPPRYGRGVRPNLARADAQWAAAAVAQAKQSETAAIRPGEAQRAAAAAEARLAEATRALKDAGERLGMLHYEFTAAVGDPKLRIRTGIRHPRTTVGPPA